MGIEEASFEFLLVLNTNCLVVSASPLQKFAPVSAAVSAAVPDEVTDLQQRLAILQGKRAEDKAKIKELEKYKAQFNQVG